MPLRDRLPWRGESQKKRKLAALSETFSPSPPTTTALPAAAAEPTTAGTQEHPEHLDDGEEQHEQSIATFNASSATTVKDAVLQYWPRAYAALKLRDEDLVLNYEQVLAKETNSSVRGSSSTKLASGAAEKERDNVTQAPTRDELVKLIDVNIQKAESRSRPIEIIDKAAKFVTAIKDFVTSAASADPHAALAWAGVSVLLPVLLNPNQQRSDLLTALQQIPSILARYQIYEVHLQRAFTKDPASINAYERLEEGVVKMYEWVLELQARSVCQKSRHSLRQFARDTIKVDDWKALLAQINDKDAECRRLLTALDMQAANEQLQAHDAKLSEILTAMISAMDSSRSIETRRCLQALYYDALAQKNRNPTRVAGTCEWFLQNSDFLTWRQDPNSSMPLLWVSADPGCGKSVLSRTLIDEQLLGSDPATANVASFFFKDNEEANRSAINALASILHQLLIQDSRLQKHAERRFDVVGEKLAESFDTLRQILSDIVADNDRDEVVILLDAFDECSTEGRRLLVRLLEYLLDHPVRGFRIIITSRPYDNIDQGFASVRENGVLIELDGNENHESISKEINIVIEERVKVLAKKRKLRQEVAERLRASLQEVENKTYLWLYLIFERLESVVGVTTTTSIQKFLAKRPDTIDAAYEDLLGRSDDQRKAKQILTVIVGARRPLTWAELKVAVAIQDDADLTEELESNSDFERTARETCGLFIRSFQGRLFLLHQTAKEFLLHKTGPESDSTWRHCLTDVSVNLELALICVKYLLTTIETATIVMTYDVDSDDVMPSAPQVRDWHERRLLNPLFEYASRYWADHLVEQHCDSELKELIITLLANEDWVISILSYNELKGYIYKNTDLDPICEPDDGLSELYRNRSNRAHFIVHHGLSFLLQSGTLSRLGMHPKQLDLKDSEGFTPLAWAVYRRHVAVVRVLVQHRSVDINSKNHNLETPLWRTVFSSDTHITSILLRCEGIDVDTPNIEGTSPLAQAVLNWNTGLVALLLMRKDVDVNRKDRKGESILAIAADQGNLDAAELLLQRPDIELESIDDEGQSPLTRAAERHFYDIVELLLKRSEVDVNRKYSSGLTPLSQAIASGDKVMAEILLGHRDINPVLNDHTDLRMTPLEHVIKKDWEEPVKLPLGRENILEDATQTPGPDLLTSDKDPSSQASAKIVVNSNDGSTSLEQSEKD